jgi:hypothetical protein
MEVIGTKTISGNEYRSEELKVGVEGEERGVVVCD